MKCPYCAAAQGRCTTTSAGRSITECTSCGRVVSEHHFSPHHLFHLRAQDTPLPLVTSDLPSPSLQTLSLTDSDSDPFEPTGFITSFSTLSLESSPLSLLTSLSFSGHLAELERTLESSNSSANSNSSSSVVVDNLRAYMQIIDVASILGLDCDVCDQALQLFRDCCSATCLRNRSVEALATAALVQAIREAQEPRTLQEISIAANVPQKEIGKYIKILGEALQLSQPINSNSISVHMPRFCNLLQLNKSAQVLATHIGDVVINKCFCTRRNPISISAAAIYLACQLEDKRKTQAEICKVTGLTEVTLRKVYKELLENWDDLLPPDYTPAVPPEKAFPTTAISSGRNTVPKVEVLELTAVNNDKQNEIKVNRFLDASDRSHHPGTKEDSQSKANFAMSHNPLQNQTESSQHWFPFGPDAKLSRENSHSGSVVTEVLDLSSTGNEPMNKLDQDRKAAGSSMKPDQILAPATGATSVSWSFRPLASSGPPSNAQLGNQPKMSAGYAEKKGHEIGNKNINAN